MTHWHQFMRIIAVGVILTSCQASFAIGSADGAATKQIQMLNSQLQVQMQRMQESHQKQLKKMNDQFQSQLKETQSKLQQQIQASHKATEAKMKAMQANLEKQIHQVHEEFLTGGALNKPDKPAAKTSGQPTTGAAKKP